MLPDKQIWTNRDWPDTTAMELVEQYEEKRAEWNATRFREFRKRSLTGARAAPWGFEAGRCQFAISPWLPVSQWVDCFSCSMPTKRRRGPIHRSRWWLDADGAEKTDPAFSLHADMPRSPVSVRLSAPMRQSYLWMEHEVLTREIDNEYRRDSRADDKWWRAVYPPPLLPSSSSDSNYPRQQRCMLAEMPAEIMDRILGHLLPTGCAYQFIVCNPMLKVPGRPLSTLNNMCYLVVQQIVPAPVHTSSSGPQGSLRRDTVETARLALAATNRAFHSYVCAKFYGDNTFVFHARLDYGPVLLGPEGTKVPDMKGWTSWLRPLEAGPAHYYYRAAAAVAAQSQRTKNTSENNDWNSDDENDDNNNNIHDLLITNPTGPLTSRVGRYIKSAVVMITAPSPTNLQDAKLMHLLGIQVSKIVDVLAPATATTTEARLCKMDKLVIFTGKGGHHDDHYLNADTHYTAPYLKVDVCQERGRITVEVETGPGHVRNPNSNQNMHPKARALFSAAVGQPLAGLLTQGEKAIVPAENLTLCGQWIPPVLAGCVQRTLE